MLTLQFVKIVFGEMSKSVWKIVSKFFICLRCFLNLEILSNSKDYSKLSVKALQRIIPKGNITFCLFLPAFFLEPDPFNNREPFGNILKIFWINTLKLTRNMTVDKFSWSRIFPIFLNLIFKISKNLLFSENLKTVYIENYILGTN